MEEDSWCARAEWSDTHIHNNKILFITTHTIENRNHPWSIFLNVSQKHGSHLMPQTFGLHCRWNQNKDIKSKQLWSVFFSESWTSCSNKEIPSCQKRSFVCCISPFHQVSYASLIALWILANDSGPRKNSQHVYIAFNSFALCGLFHDAGIFAFWR